MRSTRLLSVLVTLVLFSLSTQAVAQCVDPVPPPAGFAIVTNTVTATLSDGHLTRMDIRFPVVPPGPCGWPLIVLVHGGGGSRAVVASTAAAFASAGYVTCGYDVRGQGDGPSLNPPALANDFTGLRELIDLFEVMEDVASRYPVEVDFSRIGVTGYSQGGRHSWWAAMHSGQVPPPNPWRVAPFPTVTAVVVRDNGALRGAAAAFPAIPDELVNKLFAPSGIQYQPGVRAGLRALVLAEDLAGLAAATTVPGMDPSALLPLTTVPVYVHGSYDDKKVNPTSVWASFDLLPATTAKRLHLGTGGHDSPSNNLDMELFTTNRRRWMNRFLKGELNGVETEAPVIAQVTPGPVATYQAAASLWDSRTGASLPTSTAVVERAFLAPGGALSPTAPAGAGFDVFQHIVPAAFDIAAYTALLPNSAQLLAAIPLSSLIYDSPALAQDRHIEGVITLGLTVNGTMPDYQVHAVVFDVDPFGNARFVTRGSAAVHGAAGPQSITLSTYLQSYVFRQGHQIRVQIENHGIHRPPTGSAPVIGWVPFFDSVQVAVQRGGVMASFVDFPVIPFTGPRLVSSPLAQSVAGLENQRLQVHTSTARAGDLYLLMASLTGTAPPTPFLGLDVPLVFDALTASLLANPALPPFVNALGTLDAEGAGFPGLVLAGQVLSPALVGQEVHFASLVLSGGVLAVTNSATLTLVP